MIKVEIYIDPTHIATITNHLKLSALNSGEIGEIVRAACEFYARQITKINPSALVTDEDEAIEILRNLLLI